jgi:glycolate oxidase iron-sulfur subunit
MGQTLGRLKTDLGERSTYDAASQCSRCGYCEQACPTYVATGHESKSPRGRNQLVRLMLEGKLKDPESAREALSTCLLCGACSTACYAHVSVPDIVLEGRRMITPRPHWLVRRATRLLVERPWLFAALLKLAHLGKRLGLSALGRPILRRMGLGGLAEADKNVHEAPLTFLDEILKRKKDSADAVWTYFSPCGPNYLFPRVGLATWAAVEALRGPGRFLKNACCGLLCYNYGEIEDAKALAKKNILLAEGAPGPVVADCSSCAAFLKTYAQLFLEDTQWRARAESFSARVQDAPEILGGAAGGLRQTFGAGPVTYHDSCRACHGQGIKAEPRGVMVKACGSSFKEMSESDVCCGGAGAFSFIHPELSEEVLKRKVGHIAAAQAKTVVTSSTSCLIQLAHGLKNYYPECTVMHISELAARCAERAPANGTTPGA